MDCINSHVTPSNATPNWSDSTETSHAEIKPVDRMEAVVSDIGKSAIRSMSHQNPGQLHDPVVSNPPEKPAGLAPEAPGSSGGHDDNDAQSVSSAWTESTLVPRRSLGSVQCSSMMINQMIGTGIFTTPGYVLQLTKSKPLALGLWVVVGIYSLLSVLIYLEFGTALPYNGGALIYLDETFHHPELLASAIFSFFWIGLSAQAGNSITLARYALQIAEPHTAPSDFDDRLLRFLAIVIITVVCLLLYFARRFCFVMNNIFALFKIVLSLLLFATGMYAIRKDDSGVKDFNKQHPGSSTASSLAATVYILYSYQGWEHTNYIAGEIRAPKKTLRNAAFFSVSLVTILYTLLAASYYTFASYEDITSGDLSIGIAAQLGQRVFGSATGIRVTIILSAFSELIINGYTTVKVKQAIAWQRFIPFYKFFGRQDPQFDSPGGALVLHWLFTVLWICLDNSSSDSYAFIIGIFEYGYELMMVFLGIGILRLGKRMRTISDSGEWKPVYMKNKFILYTVSLTFIGVNILMLVMTARPDIKGDIPRFYWAVAVVGSISMGALYWALLKSTQLKLWGNTTLGSKIGFEVQVYNEGDDDIPVRMRALMEEANLDGSRRRVSYKISGPTEKLVNGYNKVLGSAKNYLE